MSKELNLADVGMLFIDLHNIQKDNRKTAAMVLRAIKTFNKPIIEGDQFKAYGVVNENREDKEQ